MSKLKIAYLVFFAFASLFHGCGLMESEGTPPKPRLSMFVGVDISGSFVKSPYYDDSINFLAHYIYSHLNGLGGLEVPNVLFVSSIGGAVANEAKTFYPRQTFENKSIEEIAHKLREIFPKRASNPFTDFNAFFEQCALTVRNKNLVLRPISIVMLSDGIPDVKQEGKTDFRSIDVKSLERLARSVTIRLLYTNAVVGKNWQTKVKRRRVKIWTQDAEVMISWKDPKILIPEKSFEEQNNFFTWIKDNVDFGVRARRVD
ncbi:MAG: hypothetical protein ACE5IW_12000 [bacterium]